MTTPDWINQDLLRTSFKKFYTADDIQILGYSCKAAVPTGDNYTSDLYRVNVTFTRSSLANKETFSVIIKIQPVGTTMEVLTKAMNLFTKEMEMFGKTLPLMYDALGPDLNGCLSSVCLYTVNDPTGILILQDLQPEGYRMAPRQQGLDYDHCLLAMKKLAQFHASSIVVIEKDPSVIKNYYDGIFSSSDLLKPWMTKGLESLADSCMKRAGLEKYGAKLRRLGDNALTRGIEAGERKLGGFNVLNHGDLWVNNMLFSYEPNGKLKDLKFVDFQLVKYSSPAMDLHYFLATTPSDDVRVKYIDHLLDTYYAHLLATLTILKCSLETVPSREDFRRDFAARGFYGILAAATVLPLCKASHRSDASFDDLMTNDNEGSFRHHCYNNDNYCKTLEHVMSYYDVLGVFN